MSTQPKLGLQQRRPRRYFPHPKALSQTVSYANKFFDHMLPPCVHLDARLSALFLRFHSVHAIARLFFDQSQQQIDEDDE